jgi:cleavage and polyadenylation specificity factor subunit 5
VTGLTRHLDEFLGSGAKQWTVKGAKSPWEVRNLLAVWWRPNFDGFFVGIPYDETHKLTTQYPYKPVHVSEPKERRKIFLVTMPPESE